MPDLRRRVPVFAVSLLIGAGVPVFGGPYHTRPGSYPLRVVVGKESGSPQGGQDALLIARRYPDPRDPVAVNLIHTRYANFFGTLFASVLRRDYRNGEVWVDFTYPLGGPKTAEEMERLVVTSPKPVRFFVADAPAPVLDGSET